ncbi:hypothetical protein K7472_03745 [Streptomyces sp. PTM05]|uniref:ATP-binding protein n=1 Tax=Streptantibioticus parmotrematis TaxID=2873249 RepID=A0ABS7QL90_9ACTN|nr:hypothetical protein [Streptantibioticus parmotrematis]MBY8883955.1 hypothetical protein [Streptantibioticus parmotrematis]
MKTGTIKTLGAAALGVAFAAAAAGSASAAPALPSVPAADPASALDALTTQLPVDQVSNLVPGAAQATDAVKGVVHNAPATLAAANGGGLLGGLPVGNLSGSLPLGG